MRLQLEETFKGFLENRAGGTTAVCLTSRLSYRGRSTLGSLDTSRNSLVELQGFEYAIRLWQARPRGRSTSYVLVTTGGIAVAVASHAPTISIESTSTRCTCIFLLPMESGRNRISTLSVYIERAKWARQASHGNGCANPCAVTDVHLQYIWYKVGTFTNVKAKLIRKVSSRTRS